MPITTNEHGATIVTGEAIDWFRMRTLLSALKLEIVGLKGRVNAYAVIKREFGLKGGRERVYEQFAAMVADAAPKAAQ